MSMKNPNDTIGNRSRDLPACSAVPQPTVPSAAWRLDDKIPQSNSGYLRKVNVTQRPVVHPCWQCQESECDLKACCTSLSTMPEKWMWLKGLLYSPVDNANSVFTRCTKLGKYIFQFKTQANANDLFLSVWPLYPVFTIRLRLENTVIPRLTSDPANEFFG